MEMLANLPIMPFASPSAWEEWLAEHHAQAPGVWLKLAKKVSGTASVTYAEALDVALCYGWIDGQKKPYDALFWLQRFTPRRPKSGWSKLNTEKVAQLIGAGRMQPSGLREVEAAKADGRWDTAYASQRTVIVPDDLRLELERRPEALAFFASLNNVNRYAICYRIETAKKPETRRARLETFLAMLESKQRLHP